MPSTLLENEINRILVDIASHARSKKTSEHDEHDFHIDYNPEKQTFRIFTWPEDEMDGDLEPTRTEGDDLYKLLSTHAKALMGQDYLVKDVEDSSRLSELFREVDSLARTGLPLGDEGYIYFRYYFKANEFLLDVHLEEHNLLGIAHDDERWHYDDCFDGMEDTLESHASGPSMIGLLSHQVEALKALILDAQKRLGHLV